jgi:flavorubredoxin
MKRAVIIYESLYGNTRRVADAIARGIMAAGDITCKVVKTSELHTDEICNYDAILFGCPNHNQAPALNMIRFLERASIVHVKDRIGGVFDTYTGGNKGVALTKLAGIVSEKFPGIELVGEGLSVKVESRKGPLLESEIVEATSFGKSVGTRLLK